MWFRNFGLPGMFLVALLQRTPVLRLVVTQAEHAVSAPLGQLVQAAFTAAALGAVHTCAGATTFVRNPSANPVPATLGVQFALTFTYTGTPSLPQYYLVSGQLPPGLNYIPAPVNGVVRSATPVISGIPTQVGDYTIRVQGFGLAGNGLPEAISFSVRDGTVAVAPTIGRQPVSQTVSAGAAATFTVEASGSPTPGYQWWRAGRAIPGATSATFSISSVQTADAGDYFVVVTNAGGSLTSSSATLTVISPNTSSRLANLSVRTRLAANVPLIVGVFVDGGTRDVLVRAAGPALAPLGVGGAMDNPRLDLFNGQTAEFANEDWPATLAATFGSVGAFPFPNGSRDAAMVRSLSGGYSIQARGPSAGIVLVEAYDTGAPTAARLANVSARNRVGTGEDILIAGFTIAGTGTKPLLLRAIGPTLGAFGVGGVLADPKLEIYNSSGVLVAENDNWAASLASTFGTVGAFALTPGSRDAALMTSLPTGGYTAQVRGADGGTGEALIEIYELR